MGYIVSLEGGGSGTPDSTDEPSGGVGGSIHRNTNEGRCLPDDPSEELARCCVCLCYVVLKDSLDLCGGLSTWQLRQGP